MCYVGEIGSRIVRARLDTASEQALGLLMRDGSNESDAVRAALIEAGHRREQRSAVAEEVRRLAADPEDRRGRRALMADMDAVTSDWPE